MRKSLLAASAAALGMVVLTGCSVPSTAADETAVQVGSGITEGSPVKGCVPAGTRQVNWGTGAGDKYYFYPENQRTYDFTGRDGSDAEPISVVSSDNQTVLVPGQINFDLNTDCAVLTAFHNNIGRRYQAYMVENANGDLVTGEGWSRMMTLYIGRAADATLDRVAKQYTWRELYSDPAIKDEMNKAVNETIKTLVDQQTDGDQEFFGNYAALIAQPDPGDALRKTLEDEQAAVSAAQATEAKAVADANAAQAAAEAQVAQKQAEVQVAQAEAQRQAAEIAPFGSAQEYNNSKAIEKGLNPYQPTYGSTTTVVPQ